MGTDYTAGSPEQALLIATDFGERAGRDGRDADPDGLTAYLLKELAPFHDGFLAECRRVYLAAHERETRRRVGACEVCGASDLSLQITATGLRCPHHAAFGHRRVIVGTASTIPGPDGAPTVPVLDRLPAPQPGQRWVGPLAPVVETVDDPGIEPWAGLAAGGERTEVYRPCIPRGGVTSPAGWAETDTSGRHCVRTPLGWWVAVPADRPSSLAAQVRAAGGTTEVGPRYRGPIRDGWKNDTGPVVWQLQNLTVRAGADQDGQPRGIEVVWCPFREGSPAYRDALKQVACR